MSHKKTRSEGYVPFSWEEKPGVSKSNHLKSESFSSSDQGTRIAPPPPCSTFQLPRRKSFSHKALWWQDDPFLAALKSCTKNVPKYDRGYDGSIRRKGNESSNKWKNIISKSTSGFSCKQSCNVESNNLDKFAKLPPIPKERYKAKSFVIKNSNISN
ncbi:hypothetical protein PHJA_002474300 [Phtheirospermum japonicum]|uniref:Uncharacterized protein n=1 Tax=Phtheirospermum japonicum TaxID=374723 RepID=A0A830D4A1_9LAMI|nr:hypothetical protein PHJA_002474300 [Phtheirospermum japonicum]